MDTTQTSVSREAVSVEHVVRQRRRVPWMMVAVLAVVAVVASAALYWDLVLRFEQKTDDAYVGGNVTVLAPKVNGFVDGLLVHDNQHVKAGDVLIRLDARDYEASSSRPSAEVGSARAAVTESQAKNSCSSQSSASTVPEVRASAAELTRATSDNVRYRELVKTEAVSNQVVERADADYTKASAAVDRSDAALIAAKRQIDVLSAQIERCPGARRRPHRRRKKSRR